MLKRIEELDKEMDTLNQKTDYINDKLEMVDSYSQHFMNGSLTIISIVIAITGIVLIGAMYFMIKSIINQKMDNEIEKKIQKKLSENPPVYYAKGENFPNEEGKIILPNDITGIKDLEPNTLLMLEAKAERITVGQLGSSLKYNLIINSSGNRVIEFENYVHTTEPNNGNGKITWAIVWIRKYSNY